jgi:diketogulonate reductase-like aldo/keto reductase
VKDADSICPLCVKHSNLDYLKAIQYLVELTESRPDLVTEIGIVNFDAKDTEQVCKYMIENIGKVGIVSNQVQVRCCRTSTDSYDAYSCATWYSSH